jgi:predicted nucleotidyltransferase component of viral defense system
LKLSKNKFNSKILRAIYYSGGGHMLMKSYLSASKCKSFDLRVREEESFSEDETKITESLQKLR